MIYSQKLGHEILGILKQLKHSSNFYFHNPQKIQSHIGLKQNESEQIMTKFNFELSYPFKSTLSFKMEVLSENWFWD